MEREKRITWIITGSVMAVIGFFLPWTIITIPGLSTIAVNGATWHVTAVWAVFVVLVTMLIISFATRDQASGLADILQKCMHIAGSLGTLYAFVMGMSSGFFSTMIQVAALHNFGSGLIVSGIGVYAREK
jgi:hypothetical protein